MKFENKLMLMSQISAQKLDPELFLDRLHANRVKQETNRQRTVSGIYASVLVLFIGVFTTLQLVNDPSQALVVDIFPETEISEQDPDSEAYLDDLALLLVDKSDDVWTTLEFFEEIDYEPLIKLMEDNNENL